MNLYHAIFTANIEKYQKMCYNKTKKGGVMKNDLQTHFVRFRSRRSK